MHIRLVMLVWSHIKMSYIVNSGMSAHQPTQAKISHQSTVILTEAYLHKVRRRTEVCLFRRESDTRYSKGCM